MTIQDLYHRLCLSYPAELSCDWDRDGMMVCPDPKREVRHALVCLDVTREAVEKATQVGADVIVSHHPFLYRPLSYLTTEDPKGALVLQLLGAGISVMCFHTRADAAPGGVSDLLADALKLTNSIPLGEEQILRGGFLPTHITAKELGEAVKGALSTPMVTVADGGKAIRYVTVCGGEGKDMIPTAIACGADAFVCGRAGYHAAVDAAQAGLTLIEAGHYFTEQPICDVLREMLLSIDQNLYVEVVSSNLIKYI